VVSLCIAPTAQTPHTGQGQITQVAEIIDHGRSHDLQPHIYATNRDTPVYFFLQSFLYFTPRIF